MVRIADAGPSIPESASTALKLTVTAVLFQPFAFGVVRVDETTGAVLSILIVTDADADSPALFTAVHVIIVPGVSALRVTEAHPVLDEMPDSGSVVVQITATSLRNQLFNPAVPTTVALIRGRVVSDGVGATTDTV